MIDAQTQTAIEIEKKTVANCAYAYGRLSAFAVCAAERGDRYIARLHGSAARSEWRALLLMLDGYRTAIAKATGQDKP